VSSTPQPSIPGFITSTKFENVLINGDFAYVIGGGGNSAGTQGITLVIYNIKNPLSPFVMSYITTSSVPWVSGPSYLNGSYSAAINGQYLFVASSGSSILYVVNISDKLNPFNVNALLITNSPGSLYGIVISGNYAYLATQSKGLTVVDITNPLIPIQVYQEGGTLNKSLGIFVSKGYAYTTNYQTTAPWTVRFLKIWSLANPILPVLIETYTLPAGSKPGVVYVQGNDAYVSDLNTNSIQIVDITIPTSPVYQSSLLASAVFNVENDASPNNLSLIGQYAYLGSGSNGTFGGAIDFYDITNKSSPIKISTLQQGVAGSAFGTAVLVNNLLYVPNYGISPGSAGTLNIYSTQTAFTDSVSVDQSLFISVQLSTSSSSAKGVYILQGCNDIGDVAVNWSDLSSTQGSVNGIGVYDIPKTDICYKFIRLSYTNTGSGSVNVAFKTIGF
jgi:hypothetical protein